MYNTLARMYQTFELWIQEPLLHDTSLYLPSLPPQYMTDRLLVVFQKNMVSTVDTRNVEIGYLDFQDISKYNLSPERSCSNFHIDNHFYVKV